MSRTNMFMEAALAIALDRTAVYGVAECACMHVELPYDAMHGRLLSVVRVVRAHSHF